MNLKAVFKSCFDYLARSNFLSYDLYDGLSSPAARLLPARPVIVLRAWQQLFVRCPVNIRPLLGISPGVHAKTLADLMVAACLIGSRTVGAEKSVLDLAVQLDRFAYGGWSGRCWGTGQPYASRAIASTTDTPNAVTTSFCAGAFLHLYKTTGNPMYLQRSRSACEFIRSDLGYVDFKQGICFRYFPGLDDAIHNANMLVAALLAQVGSACDEPELVELAVAAAEFTISAQKSDGSWYYGEGDKYRWVDNFHTGYVLDNLRVVYDISGNLQFRSSIGNGLYFFLNEFFGRGVPPKFKSNSRYPVDIQGLAQTIQTLCVFNDWGERCRKFAADTVEWTLDHMYDREGYFYFRMYRTGYVNKIHYARWSTGPMLVALAHFDSLVNGGARAMMIESPAETIVSHGS